MLACDPGGQRSLNRRPIQASVVGPYARNRGIVIELKGSLRGVGLLPIVQLLADVQETGQLRVSRGALSGQLDFDAGRLVAVSFGEERGLAALAALALAFPEAEFAYTEGPAPAERNVELTLDQLRAHLSRMGGRLDTTNAV